MNNKSIAFLHPDLGIGGAERLVVDLALALQEEQNNVVIYTNHHDPKRCFEETKNKLKVKVKGNIIPKSIFNKFQILCTVIRMIIAAIYIIIFDNNYDYIIVDQCSSPLFLLKLFTKSKIIFYCHYPDLLLVTNRTGILRKIYRFFFDRYEKFMMKYNDLVLFNSKFSKGISMQYFNFLTKTGILYPTYKKSENIIDNNYRSNLKELKDIKKQHYFLSINRYEIKKDIIFAIESFNQLIQNNKNDNNISNSKLIIAGGYDDRLDENKDYLNKMIKLTEDYDISDKIIFLKNISNDDKIFLIKNATALLYTPENEHFGIVPLESMSYGCPVICRNSGGPLETVLHNKTGLIVKDRNIKECSDYMEKLLKSPDLRSKLSNKGIEWVEYNFGFEKFKTELINFLLSLNK